MEQVCTFQTPLHPGKPARQTPCARWRWKQDTPVGSSSQALRDMTVEQLPHLDPLRASAGDPNFWFSSPAQAQAHANERGGAYCR